MNLSAQSTNPFNQTMSEDDWTLPSWVAKSPNCGLYWVYTVPDAYNLLATWRMLNPAEGVYNWHLIDTALSLNLPVFLRIWASDTSHCPLWVKIKHPSIPILHWGAPGEKWSDLLGGTTPMASGNFYALWDAGFEVEFNKFLAGFKARNYLANPNVKFMYAPGAWRWNEWEVNGMLAEIKTKAPIQPTDFVSWFKRHIDAYADAANGYAYKMVYTGYGMMEHWLWFNGDANWFFAVSDTAHGRNILCDYAVSKGMSVRQGAQEYFNVCSEMPSWGAPSELHDGANYCVIDETHPLHADTNRIIGTENEGFCDSSMLVVCSYYHLKMSTLKALQLRINWLNAQDRNVAMAPELYQYARLTMNKRPWNSPDAWVALRANHDAVFGSNPPAPMANLRNWIERSTLPYRNWEKWLIQREVSPGGITTLVYQLQSSAQFDAWNYPAYEAMRTDHASGNDYMYFGVNDAFMYGGTNNVQIKVTYLDNFTGSWRIEYDAAGGSATKQSATVTTTATNIWKTVTVAIDDAGFTNRQSSGMDFRIYNGGASDLTVRFVRVVRLDQPIAAVNPVPRAGSGVGSIATVSQKAGNLVVSVSRPAIVALYDLSGRKIAGALRVEKSVALKNYGPRTCILVVTSAGETSHFKICM